MGNAIKFSIELDYESSGEQLEAGTVRAVQAGEPLKGKVVIKVKKRVKGEALRLLVHGKEKVVCIINRSVIKHERNILQAHATIIDMTNSWVNPGKHEFPFVIHIPSSMPSSMCLGDEHQGCRITYKIAAGMGNVGTERSFRIASNPMEDVKVPCFIEPKTEEVKSLKLLSVGSVTFGASVNDTQVGRGQVIDVSAACINNTTTDIKSVDIKMVEMIVYSSHHKSFESKNSLFELKNIELPGLVTARASRETVKQIQSANRTTETDSLSREQMFHMLVSGESTISLRIPKRARDTYTGNIIKVHHYLKIKIITGVLSSNLHVKIPLFVGNTVSRPPARPITSAQQVSHPTPSLPVVPSSQPSSRPHEEIPIAAATLVPMAPPSDAQPGRVFEPLVVEAHAIIIGGTPSARVHDDEIHDISDGHYNFDNLVPLSPPSPSAPSLSGLLGDMVASVNDYTLISQRLAQPEWRGVFKNLQPTDFGSVMAHVNNDVDQPRVAKLVAESVNRFTCAHCVQAVSNTADWNRATVVSKLVPLCVDLHTEKHKILSGLTAWERVVTEEDFRRALSSR